jgi:hypothetical protein
MDLMNLVWGSFNGVSSSLLQVYPKSSSVSKTKVALKTPLKCNRSVGQKYVDQFQVMEQVGRSYCSIGSRFSEIPLVSRLMSKWFIRSVD